MRRSESCRIVDMGIMLSALTHGSHPTRRARRAGRCAGGAQVAVAVAKARMQAWLRICTSHAAAFIRTVIGEDT